MTKALKVADSSQRHKSICQYRHLPSCVGHFQRPLREEELMVRRCCAPAVTQKFGTFSAVNTAPCCFVEIIFDLYETL